MGIALVLLTVLGITFLVMARSSRLKKAISAAYEGEYAPGLVFKRQSIVAMIAQAIVLAVLALVTHFSETEMGGSLMMNPIMAIFGFASFLLMATFFYLLYLWGFCLRGYLRAIRGQNAEIKA